MRECSVDRVSEENRTKLDVINKTSCRYADKRIVSKETSIPSRRKTEETTYGRKDLGSGR